MEWELFLNLICYGIMIIYLIILFIIILFLSLIKYKGRLFWKIKKK